jgi:DNA-binding response OmpR family regulator
MKSIHILVIDDNLSILKLVTYILIWKSKGQDCHYNIHTAFDGAQGLKLVREVHPDVILLDLHMPLLDGYEVLKMLRLMENTIPIIIMTAGGHNILGNELLTARDTIITKPFHPDLLYEQVKNRLLCFAE